MRDPAFTKIESMIDNQEFLSALDHILNYETGRIKSPFSKDLNHAWYLVGSIYFMCDDFNQSLRALKCSLKHWEDDHQAMYGVACCYSELGKPKLAERYFRKALSLSPNRGKYIYNLGNALFDQNEYELAIIEYLKVPKSDLETHLLAQKNILKAKSVLAERAVPTTA